MIQFPKPRQLTQEEADAAAWTDGAFKWKGKEPNLPPPEALYNVMHEWFDFIDHGAIEIELKDVP